MSRPNPPTKSDESSAELPLEPELIAIFRGYHARAKSQFVIESLPSAPAPEIAYQSYRCETQFRVLADWLRQHGIEFCPIHALRKEFGSQINRLHGIHAASVALRHASIGITAGVYVDSRIHATSGLGGLLAAEEATFPDLFLFSSSRRGGSERGSRNALAKARANSDGFDTDFAHWNLPVAWRLVSGRRWSFLSVVRSFPNGSDASRKRPPPESTQSFERV